MDLALLARHAQRIAAGLEESALDRITAHVYEASPDFEALARIEASYVPGAAPPEVPEGSWLAFLFSKPSLEEGRVHVHVLATEVNGQRELWLKLKRAEEVGGTAPIDPGACIARFVRPGAYGEDQVIASGPAWLRAPSACEPTWRVPVTLTPLDAPERFRGLFYAKVRS